MFEPWILTKGWYSIWFKSATEDDMSVVLETYIFHPLKVNNRFLFNRCLYLFEIILHVTAMHSVYYCNKKHALRYLKYTSGDLLLSYICPFILASITFTLCFYSTLRWSWWKLHLWCNISVEIDVTSLPHNE